MTWFNICIYFEIMTTDVYVRSFTFHHYAFFLVLLLISIFFNNFQICHTVLLLLLFSEALSSSAQKPPGPNDRQTCFVRDQIWGFYIQYIHSSPAHWALFPACCITILLTYSHNAEYYIAGLNYFVIGSLYHLNSVTHFANSTPLSLPITHLFSLPW